MATDDYADFIKAIIGQLVSLTTLAKLVDKNVISPADAVDVLDDVLLQLEQWQSAFPDHQQSFQLAREYVETSLDGYRAMLRTQPD
jgi:hypothetical protein